VCSSDLTKSKFSNNSAIMTPSKTPQNKKVIVFGSTGPIGTQLIEIITKEQPLWKILAVSRSGAQSKSHLSSRGLTNVTIVKGDVENLENVQSLTRDVDLVYCCVGFERYERKFWAEHWPIVVDNLLAVTSETKPLVFCDNLYAYGPGMGISPSTNIIEASLKSKPAIRAVLRTEFQARMDSQPMALTCVGGADFFGPYVHHSFLGDTFFGNMVNGQKPLALATDKVIHDFCYAKDFANALYVASISEKAYGKFWICPHAIKNMTMRDIASEAQGIISPDSNSPVKMQVISVFLIKVLALGMTFMKEMKEMLPFWTNAYGVNDNDFCREFNVDATPIGDALRATAAYYQDQKKK